MQRSYSLAGALPAPAVRAVANSKQPQDPPRARVQRGGAGLGLPLSRTTQVVTETAAMSSTPTRSQGGTEMTATAGAEEVVQEPGVARFRGLGVLERGRELLGDC